MCRAPRPVHGKTDEVTHDGAGLFSGVPSPFTATRYHSLCVDAASVPQALEVQATTADGVVMALHHRELPIFGVQFHPESVLTPEGAKLLANFLDVAGEVPLAGEASGTPQVVAAAGGSERVSAEAAQVASVAQAIARVAAGESLTEDAAYLVMDKIMDGEATPAQISALVVGMRMKGETVDEIVGFARAMREHATPVRPRSLGAHRHVRHRGRRPAHLQHLHHDGVRGCGGRGAGRQARQPGGLLGGGLRRCARGARCRHLARCRPTWRAASTRPASASCSRSRSMRACATPVRSAERSVSAPSSTSWGRSPTPQAPRASCWASTIRGLAPLMAEVAGRLGARARARGQRSPGHGRGERVRSHYRRRVLGGHGRRRGLRDRARAGGDRSGHARRHRRRYGCRERRHSALDPGGRGEPAARRRHDERRGGAARRGQGH